MALLDIPFIWELIGALTAIAAGLVIVRAWRIRKWKRILSGPASAFLERGEKWRAGLPRGIDLKSQHPLFEVLYRSYRSAPRNFAFDPIRDALLQETRAEATPGEGPAESGPSDDERINHLVGLHSYQQDPEFVPVDAVTSNVLRHLVSVLRGKKKLKAGVEHAVLDSFQAGGGLAGAKLGSIAGVALAPILAGLSALLMPVIIVIGAWFGSVLGRKVGDRIKARRVHLAMRKVKKVSEDLRAAFLERLPSLVERLDQEFESRITSTRELLRKRQSWILRKLFPDLMTVFLRASLSRIRHDWREQREEWQAVRKQVRAMSPVRFAAVLKELGENELRRDPELVTRFQAYESALTELQEARKAA